LLFSIIGEQQNRTAKRKEWYSDFADKELRVDVVAIQYNDGAERYVLDNGLYVLKLCGEDTFTMSASTKPKVF